MAKAPTTEIGHTTQTSVWPGSPGWSSMIDEPEHVGELRFPNSVRVYDKMRTDAQVHGLYLGATLPIRRYRWFVDPRDASPERAQRIAEDLGLPVLGAEPRPPKRTKGRFSHDDHLRHALLALLYGFYFFEQVGRYDAAGLWRLRKLGVREPRTIDEIRVAPDGGLAGIKQRLGLQMGEIPVDRLVGYVWDREGGNWYGRSMLRPLYRHWLRKDELLRTDVVKHRRNGMGVPTAKATSPDVSPQQLAEAQKVASAWRAGEQAAASLPYGVDIDLKGVQGQLPDILASIRYDDQQMARAFLQMFAELGQTPNGSRALGEEFVDFFAMAQETVALWYRDTTNAHVIEDNVDWNDGEDEPAPALAFERNEDPELAIGDLVSLIDKGAITVDAELEATLRERYALPAKPEVADDAPAGQSFGYDLDAGIVTIDERRAQLGLPPRADGRGELTVPEFLHQFGPEAGDPVTGAGPPSAEPVAASARPGGRKALYAEVRAAIAAPSQRRRELYEHEVRAAVDFDALDAEWRSTLDMLLADWEDVTAAEIDDLVEQVRAAGGLDDLAAVQAAPAGAQILTDAMRALAESGAEAALGEAAAQGVAAGAPDLDPVAEELGQRASAIDTLLARSLSEAGGRRAVSLANGVLSDDAVADGVRDHLEGLSTAYLADRLGGAVTAAQNTGRVAAFEEAEGEAESVRYYASELLDTNTCEPCADLDGHEFESLEDAMATYPSGGASICEGGDRCRGSVIAVYGED